VEEGAFFSSTSFLQQWFPVKPCRDKMNPEVGSTVAFLVYNSIVHTFIAELC
jgi:hypothetical protein